MHRYKNIIIISIITVVVVVEKERRESIKLIWLLLSFIKFSSLFLGTTNQFLPHLIFTFRFCLEERENLNRNLSLCVFNNTNTNTNKMASFSYYFFHSI